MRKYLLLIVLSIGFIADAQVGVNILQPDSSAILHLASTDRGLLLPRLTSPQMDAINHPVNGLPIYNTEADLIYYYHNECWLKAYQTNCQEF